MVDRNDGGVSFREIYDFDTKSIHSQRSQQTTAHTTIVDSGGVVVRGSSRLLNVSSAGARSPESRVQGDVPISDGEGA